VAQTRVRRGSDSGAAWLRLGCGAAQGVTRRLAVRQARVRISARHPREVPPTEPSALEIWRRASAMIRVTDFMTVCIVT